MSLEILRENLLFGLSACSKTVSRRSTLPSLGMVQLVADSNGLSMSATNLETTLKLKVGALVNEPFSICVDPFWLQSVLSPRTEEKVTLEFIESDLTLLVKCGRLKTKLKGLDSDEFPLLPEITVTDHIEIDTKQFIESVESTLLFVATDDRRPALNTVYFRFNGDDFNLITTNGYGLALKTHDVVNNSKNNGVFLDSINIVLSLLKQLKPDVVKFTFVDNRWFVFGDEFSIFSQVFEGIYPDISGFESLKDYATKVTVNKQLLETSLKSAMVYTKDKPEIFLSIGDNEIVLDSKNSTVGVFNDTIEATTEEQGKLLVNSDHLLNVIKYIHGDVVIQQNTSHDPIYIYELGDSNNFWLTMPMFFEENN